MSEILAPMYGITATFMVATGAWDGRGEELGWRPGGLRAVRVRDGADGGRSSGRGGIEIRRGEQGEFANEKKLFPGEGKREGIQLIFPGLP